MQKLVACLFTIASIGITFGGIAPAQAVPMWKAQQQCEEFGFQRGTSEFARCVQQQFNRDGEPSGGTSGARSDNYGNADSYYGNADKNNGRRGGRCVGYAGPGGACSTAPGGPLYAGPGGACYAGPGGPCYTGPGADGRACPSQCRQ